MPAIARLSNLVPEDVALGFHYCFGTFGGWPAFAPDDLGRPVELINAVNAAITRRIDWIHIPTLDRTDDAFYAPLAGLNAKGARVYLGAIHSMATLKAARRGGAQISSRVRSCRLLRLRPHAARRDAAHPAAITWTR